MYRNKTDVDKHVQNLTSKLSLKEFQTRAYSIARLYFEVGDYISCQRYVEQYLTQKDNNAAALKLLGQALQRMGQKEKALDQYKASLDIDPTQTSTILEICELLADDDVEIDPGRSKYWCEKAEATFPRHPITFKLREKLLATTNPDSEALVKFLKVELDVRPKDATLHIRLLKRFLDSNQIKEAFEHSCNVEFDDQMFPNNYAWYETLSEVLKHNSLNNNDWLHQLLLLTVRERICVLSLTEVPNGSSKSLVESSDLLFSYDQALENVHKIGPPPGYGEFHTNLVIHHRGQLAFHIATYLLKKAKKNQLTWRDATKLAGPLLLSAWHTRPLDPKVNWLTHAPNKQQNSVHRWYLEGSYRCSQSGHYVLSNIQNNSQIFLDHISQFCSGTNWRDKIFEHVFTGREQLAKNKTKSNNFNAPPLRLPRKQEVEIYDHDAQRAYPNSLHHFVWILLNYKNYANFKCTLFDMLAPTMTNFGAESLNNLDILAFLYSATLCQRNKNNQVGLINPDKPIILPANITDLLCSLPQMKWWDCAYKYSQKELGTELTGIHATLSNGIEVVRCVDNHGLEPHLLCILGGIFSEKADHSNNIEDKNRLVERACLYYSSAILLLEKLKGKIVVKMPNKRLFDYKQKDLDTKEINTLLEESKVYVATVNLNEGDYEKAIELLSTLKSPKAYYHLSETYKKVAFEEKKSCSDADSETKHVSFLYKAKHFAYKSLEKIKETDVYYKNNALYSNTQELIEEIESCINNVDPDISNTVMNYMEAQFSSDEHVSLSGNEYVSRSNHIYHKQNISSTPKPSAKYVSNVNMTNYRTAVDTQILENSILDQQLLERIEKQIKTLQKRDANISDFMEQTKDWFDENRKLGNQIMSTINSNIENTTEQFKLLKISVDQVKDQINECRNDCKDVGELKKQIAELKKEVNKLKKASSEQTIDESNLYNLDDEYRTSDNASSFGANIPFVPAQVLPQFAQRLVPPFPVPTNPYQLYGQNFLNLYNQYSQFNSGVTGTPQIFDPTRPQANYPTVYPTPDQMYLDVANLVATSIPNVPTVPLVAPASTISSISTIPTVTSAPVMMSAPSSKVPQNIEHKDAPRLPVNVVITSSDPLPICTSAPAPVLSVTIPPKHIKGSPHNYQITMPNTNDSKAKPVFNFPSNTTITTTSTTVTTSLNALPSWNQSNIFATARAENSLSSFNMTGEITKQNDNSRSVVDGAFTRQSPNNSLNKSRTLSEKSNTSVENYDPCPDFKPIIPLPAEVKITTGEENETVIFASRAKLYRFVDKQWKERGLGEMKLLKHMVTGKVRVLMRREQIHKICANHIILPEMEIKPMKNEAKAYFWFANDFAEETVILEKFCVRFKTAEIAKQFYDAFEEARQDAIRCTDNDKGAKSCEPSIVTTSISIQAPTSNKVDFNVNTGKTVIGGFTFSSTPSFKAVEENSKVDQKSSETTENKTNVFSGLTFKTSTKSPFTNIFSTSSNQNVNNIGTDKPVHNDTPTKLNTSDTVEEFEPTVDFKPVIPLPALVEQKTGEEDEIVLFEHRAKLLRLDGAAKEWKERGLGNIKLLVHKENNQKIRLLMRREQIMKICCNHAVTKDMIFQKLLNVDKAVTWCAKDFSDGELIPETFCLRFKTVQICDNFVAAVKSAQSKIKEDTKAAKEEHNAAKQNNQSGFGDKFKPKPGSWYCDKCFTNNLETFAQCACCEQPKPNKPTSNNKNTIPTTYSFGFGDKFKPKAGTWECKSCMVRNEADKESCSACGSLKDSSAQNKTTSTADSGNTSIKFGIPGQTQRTIVMSKDSLPVASNWGDKFKPKQGTWECNQCLVRNEGTVDECSACNNPRNPTDNTKTSTTKFNFGILSNDSKTKNQVANLFDTPSTQKFNFGIPANQTAIVVSFGEQKATTSVFGITKQPASSDAPINFCLTKMDDNKSNKPALLPTPNLNWTEIKNFDFMGLSANNQASSSIADFINKEKEYNIKEITTNNKQEQGNTVDQAPEQKQVEVEEESDSDDIIFVNEIQATAEEKQKAKELMLPENFFTYKNNKPCQGCRGCKSDDDDCKPAENVNTAKALLKSGFSLSTPIKTSTPNFQSPTNSMYGTPTFDKTVDTSVFRTPMGAIGSDTRSGVSTTSTDRNNSHKNENTTEKSNIFAGNYDAKPPVPESDAQYPTTTKGFILAPPKLSSMNISNNDKNDSLEIDSKAKETKPVFSETSVGISLNKPIFSFNQSKVDGSETSQAKSIFGSDDQKPLNLFSGASQSSMFGPGALKLGTNKNTPENMPPGTVFGSVFSKTSNIFGARSNDNQLSKTNTTVESNDSNKTNEVKTDDATNKKDILLNVDNKLSFAALSSGGPGFSIQKKADFQWEGAGQQLFVAANKEAGDKSKNEINDGQDDSGAGAAPEEEYDPHYEPIVPLPDKVVVTTGEEDEDKLFGERCKLYRYDEKTREWKERGIGEMKLLYHPVRNTYRLLLRREQVHKAVLNMLLFKNLSLLPMKNSDCAWTLAGQNFAEGTPEHETLAARFKSVAIATTFYNKVAECVEKLKVAPPEGDKKEDEAKQTFSGVAPLRLPKHLEKSARADGDMSAQATQSVPAPPQARDQPDSGEQSLLNRDIKQQTMGQYRVEQKDQDDEDEDEDYEDHSGHEYDHYDSDAYYNEEDEESGVCYACDGQAVVRHGDEQVTCDQAHVQVSFDQDIYSPKILVTDSNTGEILADMLIHTDTQFQMAGDSCTWSETDYSTNDAIEKTVTINFSDSETAMLFRDNCEMSTKLSTYASTEP